MSRSYKNFKGKEESFYVCQNASKGMKQLANQTFRKYSKNVDNDCQNGNWYQKYFPTWDICDWKYYYNLAKIKKTRGKSWYYSGRDITIKELYRQVIK